MAFWLPQGQRDRCADELECFALGAGGLGEHGNGGRRAGEADLVAGEGGQVGEQAAEAAVGPAGVVELAGGLGRGSGGAGGGGGGEPCGAGGGIWVEDRRRPASHAR